METDRFENKEVSSDTDLRIGLFGGTFDPVHKGHIELARAALKELALDRIFFIPAVLPPHKSGQTSYADRLNMLQLALTHLPEWASGQFVISTIEEELPKPSYSYNTIKALKEKNPGEFYFILGVDAFLEIKTWGEYQKIFPLVSLVISPRIGYDISKLEELTASLSYKKFEKGWRSENGKDILLLDYTPSFVSSSDIKEAFSRGGGKIRMIEKMLPEDIISYIKRHQLYSYAG